MDRRKKRWKDSERLGEIEKYNGNESEKEIIKEGG